MTPIEWDGHAIDVAGLYKGIPLSRYHGPKLCTEPSVSSSGLRKIILESPAHFYSEWGENPNRLEAKDTKAFLLGRAVHHLLLGERWFARLFSLQPAEMREDGTGLMKPWQGNRKECKRWKAEQAKAGRGVLTDADLEQIKGMASSLGRHPLVRGGILRGQIERSIIWRDKKTGLWLKSRPDAIPTGSGDFSDLKTCQSVQFYDLQRDLGKYGYYAQGALVRSAAQEVLGISYKDFTFSLVCIEKEAPWCPRVVQLKDDDLDLGEQQNRKAIELVANCLKANDWPGPGDHEDFAHVGLSDRAREYATERLQR